MINIRRMIKIPATPPVTMAITVPSEIFSGSENQYAMIHKQLANRAVGITTVGIATAVQFFRKQNSNKQKQKQKQNKTKQKKQNTAR